jgi:hypothetical protein
MVGKHRILSFTGLLAALAVAGCRSAAGPPFQGDPLLAFKKPVTLAAEAEEKSALVAYAEPRPPDLPEEALFARGNIQRSEPPPAVVQKPPEVPQPAKRAVTAEAPPAKTRLEVFLTSQRKVRGIYGHATDYSWLQGVLDYPAPAGAELLYAGPGEADAWGGKVRLKEDDRLKAFRLGDVILVEGELVLDRTGGATTTPTASPAYLIHRLWLVRARD